MNYVFKQGNGGIRFYIFTLGSSLISLYNYVITLFFSNVKWRVLIFFFFIFEGVIKERSHIGEVKSGTGIALDRHIVDAPAKRCEGKNQLQLSCRRVLVQYENRLADIGDHRQITDETHVVEKITQD